MRHGVSWISARVCRLALTLRAHYAMYQAREMEYFDQRIGLANDIIITHSRSCRVIFISLLGLKDWLRLMRCFSPSAGQPFAGFIFLLLHDAINTYNWTIVSHTNYKVKERCPPAARHRLQMPPWTGLTLSRIRCSLPFNHFSMFLATHVFSFDSFSWP